MLAADKLLLRSTVKQKAIELREKELNLFNSNFSAVATQAALLAGFSMAFLEMSVHLHGLHFNPIAKALLHLFSTICICANVFVVSIITFVSVWGSGKALRGRDGSMSKVVEGMNKERWVIFRAFGVGLLSLLFAVACSTWLLMQWEVALLSTFFLLSTCYALVSHAFRIFKKFELQRGELVRFDDFLRALPKAIEADEEEYDEDLDEPNKPIL
uniref:Uncharacterized protein n=1 Tax=Coccolithus braarudii TaxID=221442 RepID=A0A7S0QB93_9EUKA|mmetsp:Transcript_687/g.1340  ORF Transcript_687/g.1340 Transcript_687/m.1340 type:complete len:214 (+) Transcript_687:49-690(+)